MIVGCFQLMVLMNKAVMNVHVRALHGLMFYFSWIEEELLDHVVNVCLTLYKKLSKCFPK